jgi:hypothetical protein
MAYFRLTLAPGIDKQNTEYGAEGGWTNCDNVRFRYGLPEKIGGWQYFENKEVYLVGMASEVFTWTSLSGIPHVIVGTNRKLYVSVNGSWSDITPLRDTTTAGDVTFAATDGSTILTVSDTDHGAIVGDFVTFSGATSLGGVITATVLNAEYEVTSVVGANSYTVTLPIAANASDSGDGGASVVGAYQINVGSDVNFFNFGWGVGTWGLESWGTPRTESTSVALQSRVWQFDNFGEDAICQLVDGNTFLWDLSAGPNTRAAVLTGAPVKSKFALLSTPDRHLVCFGTDTVIGDASSQDPMFVRFSNQEDITVFVESATNTAGGQRLTDGNTIVSAIRSRGQILIFTDTSLHGQQFLGPPFTFGFQQLGANCGCIGPHAAVDVNGLAFWMGTEAFYLFDGTVKKLACSVQDYVFKDLNQVQKTKVHVGLNSQFNEVTWWYCSFTSDFIDRCVTYNYLEGTWAIGTMARSAWVDLSVYPKPLGAKYEPDATDATISPINGLTAGRALIYQQETGTDDVNLPILSELSSGYFDIGDGDNMLLMSRFIPDFKDQVGNLTIRLLLRAFPQATATPSSLDPYVITPTTQKVDTRARGRQISIVIENEELGSKWRYGTLRVDIVPDGLR